MIKEEHLNIMLIGGVGLLVLVAIFMDTGDGPSATTNSSSPPTSMQQAYFTPGQSMPAGGQGNFSQVALAGPPIKAKAKPPKLVKTFGIEVIEINGGKLKVTGVMGGSWAAKAGLKRNDIILRFNKKKVVGLKKFELMISKVPPEKPYKMIILRRGKVKKVLITVGEGEMEGFTPIVPVKPVKKASPMKPVAFTTPVAHGMPLSRLYQCRRCINYFSMSQHMLRNPFCPYCRLPMHRVR